ncbi:ferritin family protein [candidate division KSB1 bacterium]
MSIQFTGEELLEMGVKIEEIGEEYYREFASKVKNKDVKELLEHLAAEEVRHKNLFISFQDKWGSEDFVAPLLNEQVSAYLKSLVGAKVFTDKKTFMNKFKNLDNPLDIINNAIIFEKDTILFYHEMKNFVSESRQHIVAELIDEEWKHVLKLEKIKQSLVD